MQIKVSSERSFGSKMDIYALVLAEKGSKSLPSELGQDIQAPLLNLLKEDKFSAKAGKLIAVRSLGMLPSKWVLLVGGGNGSPVALRRAAGEVAHFARKQGAQNLTLSFSEKLKSKDTVKEIRAVVEGLHEGNYQFDKYIADAKKKQALKEVRIHGVAAKNKDMRLGEAFGAGQNLARDLVNEPAEAIYPESMAEICKGLSSDHRRLFVPLWALSLPASGLAGLGPKAYQGLPRSTA